MATTQPTYDFLAGESAAPSPAPSARKPLGQSLRQSQIFKPEPQPTVENEDLRAKIKTLQYEVDGLRQERDYANLQHEKALKNATTKAEEEVRRAQTAENAKTVPIKKHEVLSSQLKEAQAQLLNAQTASDKESRKLKDERRVAQEEAEEARTDLAGLEREFKHAMQNVESTHATFERTIEDLRANLAKTSSNLENCNDRLSKKESKASQLESENIRLKAQSGDSDTLAVIKRELSEQVLHIRKLESTNRDQNGQLKILRQKQKAIEVVEEEKRGLESRLEAMEGVRKELREAQLQRQILEDERSSWTSYLQSQSGGEGKVDFKSPEDMARALVKQRLENTSLVDKVGVLQPEVMEKDEAIRSFEEQINKMQAEAEKLRANANSAAAPASMDSRTKKAIERQRALALKEVEFLREQLRTFDSEEQTYHSEENQFDALKTKRIADLESQVDEHRRELASLSSELSTLESSTAQQPPSSPRKRRLDEADNEDQRFGQLSRKYRKLQDDLSQLQNTYNILQNDHSALKTQLTALQKSSRTRVLSLRSNPTSEYETIKLDTLKTLKQENTDLLAQIENRRSSDGAGEAASNLVPSSTLETLRLEIKDLERTVAEKEKRMLRLKQIWGAKSLELREAVFSLLGWRMNFRSNGKFALSLQTGNQKNPDDDDDDDDEGAVEETLVFDGENGTMKVAGGMDSPFAREVRPLTREWVEGKRYIPGLMASVLLSKVGDGTVVI